MMQRFPIGRLIAAILATGLSAGCAGMPGAGQATGAELRGPWRAEPLTLESATIAAAEEACARPLDGVDRLMAGPLVAVDARGGGRLTLLFVGQGIDSSECHVQVDAAGALSVSGSSASFGMPVDVLAPNDVVIANTGNFGGSGGGDWSSVSGRIGSAITVVHVLVRGGPTLRASVGGGWFMAWWPASETSFVVEGFDANGQKVGEARQ